MFQSKYAKLLDRDSDIPSKKRDRINNSTLSPPIPSKKTQSKLIKIFRLIILTTPIIFLLWTYSTPFTSLKAFHDEKEADRQLYIKLMLQTRYRIPHKSHSIQIKSHRAQQSFCRSIFQKYKGLPSEVHLKWSEESQGGGALTHRPVEEVRYALKKRDPRLFLGWAALRIVKDIDPLDSKSSLPYSMYIYDGRFGARDIVSAQLESEKNWENMEAINHFRYLDILSRKLDLPRSEIYFVDIGANIGTFTLSIAGTGFSVIAIEAMKVNQHALQLTLCANLRLAPRITLLPVALGREPGQCAVYSSPSNSLDGTIRCDVENPPVRDGMYKRQDVDIARLDDVLKDWIPALKGKVGALKMDTEGFEPWVVDGAIEFFSQVKPKFIQLEVSQMTFDATKVSVADFLRKMQSFGYELRFTPNSRAAKPEEIKVAPGDDPSIVYLIENELASEERRSSSLLL